MLNVNVQRSNDRSWPVAVASASHLKVNAARSLGRRVLEHLGYSPDAAFVVDLVRRATDGIACLVGGVIRRTVFGSCVAATLGGDLDFILPNGDVRAFAALDAHGVPFDLNRSRHRRYRFRSVQAEFFHPSSFYGGFADIRSAVAFFDLRINSFGIELGTSRVVDPFRTIPVPTHDPGINWRRWSAMPPVESAVLALRLHRITSETPSLRISAADCLRLRREVMPAVESADWSSIEDRYRGGRKAFLPAFDALLRKNGGA